MILPINKIDMNYTFRGKALTDAAYSGEYMNLATRRKIMNDKPDHYKIRIGEKTGRPDEPSIYGTKEEIFEFMQENQEKLKGFNLLPEFQSSYTINVSTIIPNTTSLDSIIISPPFVTEQTKTVKEIQKGPNLSSFYEMMSGLGNRLMGKKERPISQPTPDIKIDEFDEKTNSILEAQEKEIQNVQKMLQNINITQPFSLKGNPENVLRSFPEEALNTMCDFSLCGLSGVARVVDIMDADTFRLLVHIKIGDMCCGYSKMIGRGQSRHCETKYPILSEDGHKDSGFYTMLSVRLNGIDSAEKNTEQGQIAKEIIRRYVSSNDNIVYYQFETYDKYGRVLGQLYIDKNRNISINKFFIGKPLRSLGLLAIEYDGGEKSDYMKKLPTFTSDHWKQSEWNIRRENYIREFKLQYSIQF